MKWTSAGEVQKLGFFQNVSRDVVQTLLNAGSLRICQKKELLFGAGSIAEDIWILLEGEVMIYNLTKHGSRKILFWLGGGHLLNHEIVSGCSVSVFCETASRAVVLKIPKKEFLGEMALHFSLVQAVMREYERYIWRLSHQLKNTNGSMITERKIAAKMWKLGRDFGIPWEKGIRIELNLNLTLLADFVGVPRENVSRACKRLTQKGLVIYRDKFFFLPNPDKLALFYRGGTLPESGAADFLQEKNHKGV